MKIFYNTTDISKIVKKNSNYSKYFHNSFLIIHSEVQGRIQKPGVNQENRRRRIPGI